MAPTRSRLRNGPSTHINAKGGVNGKKLEMIVLDTQADPQVGINAVNRLVSVEKVPVFITAWSSVVRAVAPIANDNKVVELSIGANSPDIAKLGDYVYTTFPLADVDVSARGPLLGREDRARKRLRSSTSTTTPALSQAQVYRDTFTKAGGEIVAYEAYDPKATDFTGAMLKVRSAQPDIIHLHGLVADMPQVAGADAPIGSQPADHLLFGDLQSQSDRAARQAAEGIIATSLGAGRDRSAGRRRVRRALEERGKARAEWSALHPIPA